MKQNIKEKNENQNIICQALTGEKLKATPVLEKKRSACIKFNQCS
ncbi:MAG: hypothetical protein ABIX36_17310 [Mucilaginibacter sp.]